MSETAWRLSVFVGVLLRIIAPIGLTGVAVWAENNGWGVLKIPFTRD